MLKTLKFGQRAYCRIQKSLIQRRTFLSEAYRCEEAWKDRFKFPLLRNVKPENLFIDLDHKQSTTGKISAIDIDIFANTVKEQFQIEELLTLVHNLRLTAETSNTLESTHHAVIRYLLDVDCTEDLINVLHDRLNYGIFPDYLCYNILMDTYIKRKDYATAAKIAVLPMLQEDSGNPITNALCVYCCHKHLESPEKWQKPEVPVDDSKEEIKVRVRYLRNPYFDDHFDLTDPRDLVGKTLAFYGKFMNNTLGRTCQLRGLILYKKYDDISKLIEQWLKEVKDNVVYEEVLDLIKKDNESLSEEQVTDEFKNVMSQVEKLRAVNLCKDSLIEALENEVKSAVDKQSEIDISEQLQKYIHWGEVREIVLQDQLLEIERQKSIENLTALKKALKDEEKLITFFENEEKIELEIEKIEKREQDEMDRVLKMHKAEKKLKKLEKEEEYIPPTVRKQRS
ncbi:28S ribosomal protein S27, mitochondrial-like [Hylaeus volcanicus]|uniref:28S ribosomal protein S27, mitochondrial-like n=1 Tax=Hylaeus volcanicus TaxID=313075 RepID=UPI0023B7B673|nr:28S ribosomal protein S27, mitochondrial-like [Hylaeus volcanicus]